ncbi:MAG: hypothetical protein ACJAVN_000071 [Roseivirga sp.]
MNALCLTILLGCETERDTQPERINTSEINQFSMNDKLAVRTAEGIHLLMKHAEVRELVKNEVNRQFDGDYNILLADLIRKPLTMNTGNGMQTETFGSFLQGVLGEEVSDVSRTNIQNSQKTLIDSITQYYPLLQIAIPELEDQDINDWDFENDPLPIAIVTQDKSQGSVPSISVNGTIGNISITQDPDELYLVISSNERTIAIPTGGQSFQANIVNPGLDCTGEPYMIDDSYEYILIDDHFNAQNDCAIASQPGGGSGGSSTTCDRDLNTGKDRILGLKYRDINNYRRDMDDDNGDDAWFNGGLEVHVEIRFGQSNGSITKISKQFTGARSAWRECGLFWTNCNTIWYNTNTEIATWNKDIYGDAMHYVWYERDGGGTRTETIKWTSKIGGIPVELTDTRVVNIEDDPLGESIVEYCDNTQGEGYTYVTNDLLFKVGQ